MVTDASLSPLSDTTTIVMAEDNASTPAASRSHQAPPAASVATAAVAAAADAPAAASRRSGRTRSTPTSFDNFLVGSDYNDMITKEVKEGASQRGGESKDPQEQKKQPQEEEKAVQAATQPPSEVPAGSLATPALHEHKEQQQAASHPNTVSSTADASGSGKEAAVEELTAAPPATDEHKGQEQAGPVDSKTAPPFADAGQGAIQVVPNEVARSEPQKAAAAARPKAPRAPRQPVRSSIRVAEQASAQTHAAQMKKAEADAAAEAETATQVPAAGTTVLAQEAVQPKPKRAKPHPKPASTPTSASAVDVPKHHASSHSSRSRVAGASGVKKHQVIAGTHPAAAAAAPTSVGQVVTAAAASSSTILQQGSAPVKLKPASAAASEPANDGAAAPAAPAVTSLASSLPPIDTSSIRVPAGWKLKTCDVCIVGAGAAGLQCAERLSRGSPISNSTISAQHAAHAAAAAAAPAHPAVGAHPLSIVVLEGRDRIGGRVHSQPWTHDGKEVMVELGAAFIHGCDKDGTNLAFTVSVARAMQRRIKDDFLERWFGAGCPVPDANALRIRKLFSRLVDEHLVGHVIKRADEAERAKAERLRMIQQSVAAPTQPQPSAVSVATPAAVETTAPSCAAPESKQRDAIPQAALAHAAAAPSVTPHAQEPSWLEQLSDDSASPADRTSPSTPEVVDLTGVLSDSSGSASDWDSGCDSDCSYTSASDGSSRSSADPPAIISRGQPSVLVTPPTAASHVQAAASAALTAGAVPMELDDVAEAAPTPSAPSSSQALTPALNPDFHSMAQLNSVQHLSRQLSSNKVEERKEPTAQGASAADPIGPSHTELTPAAMAAATASPPTSGHLQLAPSAGPGGQLTCHHPSLASALSRMGSSESAGSAAASAQADAASLPQLSPRATTGHPNWSTLSLRVTRSSSSKRVDGATQQVQQQQSKPRDGSRKRTRAQRDAGSILSQPESEVSTQLGSHEQAETPSSPHTGGLSRAGSAVSDSGNADTSVQELLRCSLDEMERQMAAAGSPLADEDKRILESLMIAAYGYVVPLDALSANDLLHPTACDGGERYLVNGYIQVLQCLQQRAERRARRHRCTFEILHRHTVNAIEQEVLGNGTDPASSYRIRSAGPDDSSPTTAPAAASPTTSGSGAGSSASPASGAATHGSFTLSVRSYPTAPYALVYCSNQRLLVACRFVVCTTSIGIMHNSLRFSRHLADRHAHLLQQRQSFQHQPYRTALRSVPQHEEKESAKGDGRSEGARPVTAATPTLLAPMAEVGAAPHLDIDLASPLAHQLEAAILFHPPLSQRKVVALERIGMGLENKIIAEFPPHSRFWPRLPHLIRSVTYPHWRFYNLDAIRGDECDILLAHLPPPYSLQMESMSVRQVQDELMTVLRDALSTARNGGPQRPAMVQPRQRGVIDMAAEGYVSEELQCADSSDEDEPILQLRRQQRQAQFAARRQERAQERERQAAIRADKTWQTRPVVLPLRIHVTRWQQDPFAQGAYSYVPVGCHQPSMVKRLQEAEPPSTALSMSAGRKLMASGIGVTSSAASAPGVLLFAGEATDAEDMQQVHGAMRSGERVAEQILHRLQGTAHYATKRSGITMKKE